MSKKSSQLFAVIIGTLSTGFSVAAVDTASGVEPAVVLAREHGVYVEVVPVLDPADKDSEFEQDRGGNVVVFLGSLGGGQFYGPFDDDGVADEFGDSASEDSDYRVFTAKSD